MALGAKKHAKLVEQALHLMDGRDIWRVDTAAIVDFMLAREEANAAPLLAALHRDAEAFACSRQPINQARVEQVLRDYAAAQQDTPEPTLTTLLEAVEAMRWVQPTYNGSPSCAYCGQQQHMHKAPCEIDAILARARGGVK